jgi:hypothetical protein
LSIFAATLISSFANVDLILNSLASILALRQLAARARSLSPGISSGTIPPERLAASSAKVRSAVG